MYRNPYNSYASYRGKYWHIQYPEDPVCTPQRFGRHWRELLEGFIASSHKVNSIVLKYEDLCERNVDFDNLESFLGLKLNKKVLDKVIFSTKKQLSSEGEIRVLSSVIEPLASSLGYSYQEELYGKNNP